VALEAAGVSDVEESVYRLLVTSGRASATDVAHRTGLNEAEAVHVLHMLASKGMASHTDGRPRFFRATPPDVALLPRLKRSADALDLARAEATSLLESYRDTMRRQDAGELIEVITGAEALRQHLRQIQASAHDEMLWFCKAQYVAMPSGSNTSEFDALARGVRYRVVYEKAFFDDEGAVDNVVAGVRAGETARAVPHLPLRLAIADRSIAVCPLVPGGPRGSAEEPTAALVRDSNLLAALIALFERYWEDAVPLGVDDSGTVSGTDGVTGPDPLTATDLRLLALLVAGVADKAIATQMGLSRRTVQRRIQHMMELAGAATRMQLAWHAARRGWL
jgi:sugar-specific transcriptional regulator TrmB/DNA-binding CsgD family transcriptional regulator